MTSHEAREARETRRRQFQAARVLGMQTGAFRAPPDAATVRKHLCALLDVPASAEHGLPGCVVTEYKRCGKARCRCNRGQPHGPYYYWYGRLLGLTWKRYLPRAEAPRIIALCRLGRERRLTRRRAGAALRLFKARWRAVAALLGDEPDDRDDR